MHDMFVAFLVLLSLTTAYNELSSVFDAPAAVAETICAELLAACVLIVVRLIMLLEALALFALMAKVNEVRLVALSAPVEIAKALELIEAVLALVALTTETMLLMFFEIPLVLELTANCRELT